MLMANLLKPDWMEALMKVQHFPAPVQLQRPFQMLALSVGRSDKEILESPRHD